MNDGTQETRVAAADDATEIVAFKGFDSDLRCRGFQFEVGKTYTHDGAVEICASGFHACEYPLDVFSYYAPAEARFALVRTTGNIARHSEDSKIACASLTIEAELRIPDLVTRAVEWILARVDRTKTQTNTGSYSAATSTGSYSAATNTGSYSAATSTGGQSAATNTGSYSAATNTGYQSAATNTGSYSAATSTGDYSAATSTGSYSAAEVSGDAAVAIAAGYAGRARASAGGAICLVNRADDESIRHIRAARVGDGIKPDTWYVLNAAGEFEEAA